MKKFILALALASTPALAVDRVAQYDFDQDGKVSFDDVNRFCTVTKALFDRADKNSDGFLTNAEMIKSIDTTEVTSFAISNFANNSSFFIIFFLLYFNIRNLF